MNSSQLSDLDQQDGKDFAPSFGVALSAAILSLVLGLSAITSNCLLLLMMYRDPLRHFRSHATSYLVFSLAVSDLLGGLACQLLYASFLFSVVTTDSLKVLYDIAVVSSHLVTKISILTVVALSIDRFLAIRLRCRYKNLVTVKKALICDVCIWLSTGLFESIHATAPSEEIFHTIDLHIQTTLPLATLFCVYLATYISFKRYTRNTVLVLEAARPARTSRPNQRNAALEKKMATTVVLIFIVLFVSHIPNFVVNDLEERCHRLGEQYSCLDNSAFVAAKAFSLPFLCVSCALNPFFYAFRIPQYSLTLKSFFGSFSRQTSLGQSSTMLPLSTSIALPTRPQSNGRENTISY